jgi:glycosyltransferase involved in cell wall biosynthesis
MTIAVNTGFSGEGQPDDTWNFIFECLSRLAEKHPQHQFVFLFDKLYPENGIFSNNVTTVITGPRSKNTLLWQCWFNYKLPALLKKHKADVLISMDGICSLRTKLPQCLFVPDLTFLQYPKILKISQAHFFKKFMPEFLTKAKSIATVSQFSKSVIVDEYKIDTGKIDVVYSGISEMFKPILQKDKEAIKEKYTEGKEYFLSPGNSGPANNLVNLLKAFSFFKKRQKSNMMLLIAGNPDEHFTKQLQTFKFRNEVRLLENLPNEELAKITAAAYAMVYPALYADFATAPLQAMQCEVPVVSSNAGALPELCGGTALYSDPNDFKDIAENMMLVFKDENKAKELVKAGKIQARLYQWDKTIDLFWQFILKAINH